MNGKNMDINDLLDSIKKSSDKEAVLLESHPASPILKFVLEKKIAPLNLAVSNKSPQRVNILIGIIDFKYFFGGYITVFNLAKKLFREGYNVRMVIVDECPFEPYLWRQKIKNYEGLEEFFDYIEVIYAFNRSEVIECNPKDVFIATSWWTAYVANDTLKHINADRFIYLTQEYEPIFYDFGSLYVLTKMTYDFPHYAIFSTEILREYHRQNRIGLFKDDPAVGEQYSVALQNAITKVDLDTAGIITRKIKRLLFYARPEPHASRNLYEIGILALSRAIRKGYFEGDKWEFYGIGTVADVPDILIDKANNIRMKLLPKVSLNEYKKFLTQFDVGLSLMLSPHPSLVPIEMASAGMIVVTNTFANKTKECLEEISPNFIAADPSIEGVEQALVDASKKVYDYQARIKGAKVNWSQSWEESLNDDFMSKVKGFINQAIDTKQSTIQARQIGRGERRLAGAFIKVAVEKPNSFIDIVNHEDRIYKLIRCQDSKEERTLYFYFKAGREIFHTVRKILDMGGKAANNIDSFLELECGHGILTRFLVNVMDPQKIWVSDFDANVLEFQKKYFNVNSFYSNPDPSKMAFTQKFEIIYMCSLFSQIPKEYFELWFGTLFSILKDDGILIFSVKGDRSEIEKMAGGSGINNLYILEKAFFGCQDIYVATKRYIPSLNGLCPVVMPQGNVDEIGTAEDGGLRVWGWAVDNVTNSPVKEVNVYYDGELMGKATLGVSREDVRDYTGNPNFLFSGWEYRGKLPPGDQVVFMDEGIIAEIKGHNDAVTYLITKETFRIEDVCRSVYPAKAKEMPVRYACDPSSKSIWDNSMMQYCINNFKIYWELLDKVSQYQNRTITGDGNLHYFTYTLNFIKEKVGRNGLRGLFIGCMEGDPGPEVNIMEMGLCNTIEVMDIAEGLLKKQEKRTLERGIKGIEYIAQDCNELHLEENAYDFIFGIGTIHHIENLELLFDQINRGLKENGIFMMREYVGPNRLQFTEEQLSIINEILSVIPEKYKIQLDGTVKDICRNSDIDELLKIDPSESVRSQDILQVISERLEIIKLVYTGGTILHPLLNGIASHFEGDEDAEALLKLLIFFEKYLIQNNILPSDYVYCMAKKRKH